jgi:Domain of unknown function (DUF4382)/Carboxypeptidase regulatory-like domain
MKRMNGSVVRWMARFGSLAAALALAACGGGGGGGAAGGGSVATGTLQMAMTDAPSCYQSVVVNVAKVRVHMSDDTATGDNDKEWQDIVPAGAPVAIDLLNLTNGQLAALGRTTVPAGKYHQVRLVLANTGNTVTPIGGTPQPLKTPSGQESGLKLKVNFDVAANQVNDVLLDFDACKSVVQTGSGAFILKPVVRLSAKPNAGIQGFLTTTLTLGSTTVSAQQNGNVVRSTVPDSSGKFTLAYLPTGTYTVVITSDGRATRVIDSVPVGTSTVSLNTGTSTIVLSASPMSTITGTVTASTQKLTKAISDDALVAAMQTVSSRLVEVTKTRVDDDTGKYGLRVPTAAPELVPFLAPTLNTVTADTAAAGKYTVKVSGEDLATKTAPADVSSGPAVVNFTY